MLMMLANPILEPGILKLKGIKLSIYPRIMAIAVNKDR